MGVSLSLWKGEQGGFWATEETLDQLGSGLLPLTASRGPRVGPCVCDPVTLAV